MNSAAEQTAADEEARPHEEASPEEDEPDDGGEIEATEDAPPDAIEGNGGPLQDVLINEEAENQKANRLLRATYADKAHSLAAGCLQFWAVAISANGIINFFYNKQMLSDTAIIAMTTGVTVNVLAAFLGVIRGLFPSDAPKTSAKKKQSKGPKKGN